MTAVLAETSTLSVVRDFYPVSDYASDRTVVSPSRQAELAEAYFALPDRADLERPRVRAAWRAMAREVADQKDWLRRHGFTFSVTESDPYASAADMFADVEENRHIACFATASTGGHPVFTDEENDAFRQVHDVLGHFAAQRGFDRHGEEAAFSRHVRSFSPLAAMAMATETRGQNAGLIATGDFVDEKIAALPAQWRKLGALLPTTEAEATEAEAHARQFPFYPKVRARYDR